MNILDLMRECGLHPKRVSSTKGGEYHSPCPICGGTDRFMVWPQTNRFNCRRCERYGDAIQFCRDVWGLKYVAACEKVGVQPKERSNHPSEWQPPQEKAFQPELAVEPPEAWKTAGRAFVDKSKRNLLESPYALSLLQKRGLTRETIEAYELGWNPTNLFESPTLWGLEPSYREDGRLQSVYIPQGLVIPQQVNGEIVKLKMRCTETGKCKYLEVRGGMKALFLCRKTIESRPIVLIESEFDAILLSQCAGKLCHTLALGGAGKRPDYDSHKVLRNAPLILFSLDFDDAGKKAFRFWKELYIRLKPWPTPEGKSAGDAFELGIDLEEWVKGGLDQ